MTFFDLPEDFHAEPFNDYRPSDEFDFSVREAEMDEQFNKGLKYKSRATLNLSKQKPR